MATTKKTTIIESDEPVAETQPIQVVTERSLAHQGMSKQGVVTIAIVSGVVLFFLGMGLGYMCGHNLRDSRPNMMNSQGRGYDADDFNGGMMRGGYYRNNAQQAVPNSGSGTTNNQTAPQTQSN